MNLTNIHMYKFYFVLNIVTVNRARDKYIHMYVPRCLVPRPRTFYGYGYSNTLESCCLVRV